MLCNEGRGPSEIHRASAVLSVRHCHHSSSRMLDCVTILVKSQKNSFARFVPFVL
jgi:hypothetical protein